VCARLREGGFGGGRGWLPAGWIARNRARDDSEGERVACRGRVGLLALEMKAGS
jgi:hypothetical protein